MRVFECAICIYFSFIKWVRNKQTNKLKVPDAKSHFNNTLKVSFIVKAIAPFVIWNQGFRQCTHRERTCIPINRRFRARIALCNFRVSRAFCLFFIRIADTIKCSRTHRFKYVWKAAIQSNLVHLQLYSKRLITHLDGDFRVCTFCVDCN